MGKKSKGRSLRVKLPSGFRVPFQELCNEIAPVAMRLGLKVFLVGGAVRDLLVSKPFSGEWDVVVFGGGDEGARHLAGEITCARGGGTPVNFPRFGTCMVPSLDYRIEFAQANLRSTLKSLSPDSLTADALSRDFTLNALYVALTPSEHGSVKVLDPTSRGVDDLSRGCLRTPIPSSLTFGDDPLRVFRAARFRACHSYRVDPAIGRAARKTADRISDVAPERILEEMNLILLGQHPSLGLDLLGRWNAFKFTMPEIHSMVGFKQNNPFHFPSLFAHTLRVVDRSPPDLTIRWAALLHDCGKPLARTDSTDGDSYYGHEAIGAELAGQLLKRLKAGKKFTREVSELVGLHMVHYQDEWSDRAVRRFIHRSGEQMDRLLSLVEADSASLKLRKEKLHDLGRLRQRVSEIQKTLPKPRSPLTGREIMEILEIEPGLSVGRAKSALVDAVVEGDVLPEKDSARRFLVKWWKEGGDRSH